MIDVSELMTDPDFARRITLRRPRATTFGNEGEAQTGYLETTIMAIVQPAQPADLKVLPEGSRIDDVTAIWCAEEIGIGDAKTTEPDVFIIDGAALKAVRCEPWVDNGYFKVFATGFVP